MFGYGIVGTILIVCLIFGWLEGLEIVLATFRLTSLCHTAQAFTT